MTEEEKALLQKRLQRFEAARDDILLGEKEASISHSNDAGSRSLSFTRADLPAIEAEIKDIRRKLGMPAPSFSKGRVTIVGINV